MIKILIADDHQMFIDGLRSLLDGSDDICVVGQASNGLQVVELCNSQEVDIVIMDINMPEMDGVAAAEIISQRLPGSPIIMMSVHGEAEQLRRAIAAGAREFLVKPFSSDEFSTTIRRVFEKELERR